MKNAVFRRVKPCFFFSALQLLVTANVVPRSPILVTFIMEAISFSETSVLSRVTPRNFSGVGILHTRRRKVLKSCILILYSDINFFLPNCIIHLTSRRKLRISHFPVRSSCSIHISSSICSSWPTFADLSGSAV
jgi:hypothetical protein